MTNRPSKLLAGALLVLLLVACGDDGTGPDGPRAIREGTWTGSAEFGSLTLDVASGGTAVSKVSIAFASWRCGSTSPSFSGTVEVTRDPPWPITNRAITIELDLQYDPFGSDRLLNLSGSFADDGSSASGSWDAVWANGTCSGSWVASR
jgi:hypothetical protein